MTDFLVDETDAARRKGLALALEGYPYEPGLMPIDRRLAPRFAVRGWREAYLGFLRGRVLRNPRDLLAHTQRVLINARCGDADACFGAMLDLFLALGSRGRALKRDLLREVQARLTVERNVFLYRHLKRGLGVHEAVPHNVHSCLSSGAAGCVAFIQTPGKTDADRSVSDAGGSIEAELEPLRLYLEQTVATDPGDVENVRALLEIYRAGRMSKAFRAMQSRLIGRRIAVPEEWTLLERSFGETDGPSAEAAA